MSTHERKGVSPLTATLAAVLGLFGCTNRAEPTPTTEAKADAPRPTLVDGGNSMTPEEEPSPMVAKTSKFTDPFAITDEELELELGLEGEVPAEPDVSEAVALGGGKAKSIERWDEYANVRALAIDEAKIYFADMMGIDGKVISKIRAVPLDGGEVETVVADQGRIDAIAVEGDSISWVAMPAEGGPPQLLTRTPMEDETTVTSDAKYGTANGLARLGEALFFVLPVIEQGRLGGLARISVGGGKKSAVGRTLGPAFAPVTDGERVYFMAHAKDEGDVIYSVDASGAQGRAHVQMPRGLVALAVDASHIYWARIGDDGRSTVLGRVDKSGEKSPELLAVIADHVVESLALSADAIWLGTSPAALEGFVARLPKAGTKGKSVNKVLDVPRVWGVFGNGERVFVHVERQGADGNAHRAFLELRP